MATVSQQLKGTFSNAKKQFEGFEKKAAKQVALLEKKAKASIDDVKERVDEVPTQLRGAWDQVVGRVRGALDFASNDDLKKLAPTLSRPDGPVFLDCKLNAAVAAPFMSEFHEFETRS